jgi:hypothetical protein
MSNSEAALAGKKPSVKTRYRVTNWREYDRALVKRGNLTVWFEKDTVLKGGCPEANGKRGAPFQYSDIALQTLLTMKAVLHRFLKRKAFEIHLESHQGRYQPLEAGCRL